MKRLSWVQCRNVDHADTLRRRCDIFDPGYSEARQPRVQVFIEHSLNRTDIECRLRQQLEAIHLLGLFVGNVDRR